MEREVVSAEKEASEAWQVSEMGIPDKETAALEPSSRFIFTQVHLASYYT